MSPRTTAHGRHHQYQSSHRHRHTQPSTVSKMFCFARVPSAFNIARAVIYVTVLLWTVICLAIAIHLHGLLETSDLTRFIPFAIFVCSVSLLIMLALLGCTLLQDRNPISTRIEMGCLGLAGVFWLSLGGFLATSDSDTADVECFASADLTSPVNMPGFSTETYQAQYRVLEAFSLFNTILLWSFLIFLLLLAIRQHFTGHQTVWYCPVTSYSWFDSGKGSGSKSKLPEPVSTRSRSRGRSYGGTRQSRWTSSSNNAPVRAYLATDKYDKYKRGASPRR
jgi:hypothetical protein